MDLATVARRLRDDSRSALRTALLHRGLAQLERTIRSGRTPNRRLCERLVRGWSNEAWSANAALLSAILEWLPKSSGPIAECGSGLSTLVLATAASLSARPLHTFEHDDHWRAKVMRELPAHLGDKITISVSPLRSYGEYEWYSPDTSTLPDSIGFVLCDGPPGNVHGGRYGLAPLLGGRLANGCLILLDDTQRPEELCIVRRWQDELKASIIAESPTYAVLRVAHG